MKIYGMVALSSLMMFSTVMGAERAPVPLEPLGGAWYKAHSLWSVLSLIPRDGSPTLVIFDYDSTMFHLPVYDTKQLAEWKRLQSVTFGPTTDKIRSDSFCVRHYPRIPRPTEAGHRALINELHEVGCTTLLVSSRASALMPLTLRDLAQEGISFVPPASKPHLTLTENVYRMYLCQAINPPESSYRHFHYQDHVIHTNGMPKGPALNVLAARFNLDRYGTVIAIDDDPDQLDSYASQLEEFAAARAREDESSLRYHLLHYQTPDPSKPLPTAALVAKSPESATLGQLSHPELAALVAPPSPAAAGGAGSHSAATVAITPPVYATTPPSSDGGLIPFTRTESGDPAEEAPAF